MKLAALVAVSLQVGATRSRLKKRALLSDCLRQAASGEISLAVHYLCGVLPQGRIGLGPAILRDLAVGDAVEGTLSLVDADATFRRIAAIRGKGSQEARKRQLSGLFGRATPDERDFLVRLVLGELRQGALEGVLVDAIADAASLPAADVRRAVMLAGEPAAVAAAALSEGQAGLGRFRLEPLVPIQPMLAQPTDDMDTAIETLGEAALEYKLDGARVQIHRVGRDVRIFTRRLNDVTASLPEVVDAVLALPGDAMILDGETIALRDDGRPHPFQTTMRRFGRRSDVDTMRERIPLDVFLFDCLHLDGEDLIDVPGAERFSRLRAIASSGLLVPRIVTADARTADEFLRQALARGHEGVMAKSLDGLYAAGSRGADWLKVKQVHTLDLVVLAAEWGSGRRKGWLSNLHLGARDAAGSGYIMLGKTFKGLTDAMLEWQTRRLLELEIGREGHIVHVRPELVVEIAVNEIQRSPQYPAGMALRFARVKGYRRDKRPEQADTIDTVREIYRGRTGPAPV